MPVHVPFYHSLPRRGNTHAECEDAFRVQTTEDGTVTAVVCDGASDGIFAGEWATFLAEAGVEADAGEGDSNAWPARLDGARRQWDSHVRQVPLPWHMAARRARGTWATFLQVQATAREWKARAVGDTCVFHVRADTLLCAFPVARSDDFGQQPALVGTHPPAPDDLPGGAWADHKGTLEAGDDLFLMTDALAAWFLREWESGRLPWRWLRHLGEVDRPGLLPFADLVDHLRGEGKLANDDVTLVHLRKEAL